MPDQARAVRPPAHRPWVFAAAWLAGAAAVALDRLGVFGAAASGLVSGAVALALLLVTAVGAFAQRSGFLARPTNAAAGLDGRVLLIFDDGPDPRTTPAVLELLRQRGHRATFFVIGERAARHPSLVRQIHAEGHDVALHTMTHRWHFCFWHPRRMLDDLLQVRRTIEQSGAESTAVFRPPMAVLSPRIAVAGDLGGLQLAGHTARAFDASPAASPDRCLARLERHLRPGAILSLHDTSHSCGPLLLGQLLDELADRRLVSVNWNDAFGRTPPVRASRHRP